MKTGLISPPRRPGGYALLVVLCVAAVSLLVLASTMQWTSNCALLNERSNQYARTLYAAEAATEKVIGRMRYDYGGGSDSQITNNLGIYRGAIPTAAESSRWNDFLFTDAQGGQNRTYVQCISNRVYVPIQSQYYALNGWRTVYRVLSNARQTTGRFNLTTGIQQDVETDSIPVFQFAIFYNGLLEFTWAAPLTVRGRTHANGPIFLGSASALTFGATVTTTGFLGKTNWNGHALGDYTGSITYSGSPLYRTNVPVLQLPIGTNNSPAAVREILYMPPAGEAVNSPMGEQRYFNKAGIVLLVSNTIVNAIIKNAPDDFAAARLTSATNASALATNFPFLTLTNSFTDQREANKLVKATQIDIGKFNRWILTNSTVIAKFPAVSGTRPNILYVADNRTVTGSQLAAVRINNGAAIPTNGSTGFTLATPNPLYVWGDYNNPGGVQNSTNTTQTQPASLVCDALTILSSSWQDNQSAQNYNSRNAVSTTVNAALIAGIVYSTGPGATQFSGGVVNYPRLLEDWSPGNSTVVLTLNSSLVSFYNSARATNQFQNPGVYYAAPTRNFNFDPKFLSAVMQPPGTPAVGVISRSMWANPPPNTTNYAGF